MGLVELKGVLPEVAEAVRINSKPITWQQWQAINTPIAFENHLVKTQRLLIGTELILLGHIAQVTEADLRELLQVRLKEVSRRVPTPKQVDEAFAEVVSVLGMYGLEPGMDIDHWANEIGADI